MFATQPVYNAGRAVHALRSDQKLWGWAKVISEGFRFSDLLVAHESATNTVSTSVLFNKLSVEKVGSRNSIV
jgi:hypothetical protein